MGDSIGKVKKEKQILSKMIELYCRKNHKNKEELCPSCQKLLDYALSRSQNCVHRETKTFCSRCKTPCYTPEMRTEIRRVMKFSGPRILFYYPLEVFRHLLNL